jgi:hypothetical protein
LLSLLKLLYWNLSLHFRNFDFLNTFFLDKQDNHSNQGNFTKILLTKNKINMYNLYRILNFIKFFIRKCNNKI